MNIHVPAIRPDHDRDEIAGRMLAGIVRAVRRLRGGGLRRPARGAAPVAVHVLD
jgi:hypothetical protein